MQDPADWGYSDGKEPGAMRTIGEVAKALGIRQHVLRYWEEQFPALRPVKRSGGRRYYRPDDVALIARINRLVHHEGYTLRGAKLALGSQDEEPVPAPAEARVGTSAGPAASASHIADLSAIRDRLAAALDRA